MAITAAQLEVKVVGNTLDAETKLAALSAQNKAFMASAAGVHMGAMLAMGGIAAIGVAAGIAVHQAADFQTQLTQLVTGAGLSADKLGMVRKGILQMAVDLGTSTDQLTSGMYMISSAGYPAAQALNILRDSAEGAKVGAADLGTVANAVTTMMTDFKDQNVTSAQAVNVLVATVANGKTHMQELADSLSQVAPTAAAAHIKIIDVMAAMATMTGEGVDAASAATYLRQAMIELNAPGTKAKETFAAIGITSDQVAATMRQSLPAALKLITDRLAATYGEGTPKYIEGIKNISGGLRQMQAMLDTTGVHMDQFIKDVGNITDQVQKGGTSIVGWSMVQDTFNQQMAKASAAVQVLFITVGSQLLPVLTKIVAAIVPVIANFTKWITGVMASKEAMDRLGPVLVIAAGVIGGIFVAALVSLAAAAWAALVPFLVFAAPFIAVGVAIAVLVVGIKVLIDHWNLVVIAVKGVFEWFGNLPGPIKVVALVLAGPLLIPILAVIAAIKLLTEHWKAITDFLGKVWKLTITPAIDDLRILANMLIWLGDKVAWVADKLKPLIDLLGKLKDAVGSGLSNVAGGLHALHVPGFAEGGTTPGGPVIVGERGAELMIPPAGTRVFPLPGGLATRAGGSAAGAGAQQTIIIQLDGRTVAQVVAKNLPSVIRLATGARSF